MATEARISKITTTKTAANSKKTDTKRKILATEFEIKALDSQLSSWRKVLSLLDEIQKSKASVRDFQAIPVY